MENIISKVLAKFKRKEAPAIGFELLKRLSGSTWDKEKMLSQYEKSLYVFACVSKIAEKVSSIDFQLFKILNSAGDTKELYTHPALDLLYRVNPYQTATEFLKITIINKKLCGDAFWYKVRNNSGRIVELWNLRPDRMEIVKDGEEYIKGYILRKNDGTEEHFEVDEIVHFKSPTPLDSYFGVSPIKSAQVRIDTEHLASSYQRDFFLNNARPDAIIKSLGNLDKETKTEIREAWEKRHRGAGKGSRVGIFEGGLEYQQISISQREMDYIESMKFTRDDILVAFGVPKPIVAITDDVNRANAETAMHIFLSEVIKPEEKEMVEILNEMMIGPDFGFDLFLGFVDPTPENRDAKLKEYESGIKTGWMLINEVRARENLEPIEGGDTLYMPINMIPVGEMAAAQKAIILEAFNSKRKSEARKRSMEVFRGKGDLRERFLMVENFVKKLKEDVIEKAVEAPSVKGAVVPLIKGKKVRKEYGKMILKGIDTRAERMKGEINKKANNQKDALLVKLRNMDMEKSLGGDAKNQIADFYKSESEVWAEFAFPFIQEYAREAGFEQLAILDPSKSFQMTDALLKSLEKRAKAFGLGISKTTRVKVTKAIKEGLDAGEGMVQISNRIGMVYREFPDWRSDLIARTESTAANNEATLAAFKQSQVATHKEWMATDDSRTRAEHVSLDGEIVSVDSKFSNGLMFPSECNCRCVLAPAFEK